MIKHLSFLYMSVKLMNDTITSLSTHCNPSYTLKSHQNLVPICTLKYQD